MHTQAGRTWPVESRVCAQLAYGSLAITVTRGFDTQAESRLPHHWYWQAAGVATTVISIRETKLSLANILDDNEPKRCQHGL